MMFWTKTFLFTILNNLPFLLFSIFYFIFLFLFFFHVLLSLFFRIARGKRIELRTRVSFLWREFSLFFCQCDLTPRNHKQS